MGRGSGERRMGGGSMKSIDQLTKLQLQTETFSVPSASGGYEVNESGFLSSLPWCQQM